MPRGEFNIVIAGLAVSAGTNTRLGPLAAAYVLILAVAGPVLARTAEPLAARLRARRARHRAPQTDDDVPVPGIRVGKEDTAGTA
jgi:CPA2 family monovalent cation:H+ antiporter-2